MLAMNPFFTFIAPILSILACFGVIYCIWQISSLNRLRKNFFTGTRAISLESVIFSLEQKLKDSQNQQAALEQSLHSLGQTLNLAVQKVGLVRFNPFEDAGGNFSFTLALLDAHNSGVVITSMHGRQQNRIYSKKIDSGLADTKLTQEEQQAVDKACLINKT